MSKKQRDEAIEIVGRALYGSHWIGELQSREWKIGKAHPGNGILSLPSSGKQAAAIAAARFRSQGSDEQSGQVFRWLHEQGINCVPGEFDASAFNAWFAKKFPAAARSATTSRVDAVRALLKAGHRPGRGGPISWKAFCGRTRARCGQRCDDKTIKRDVQTIRAKG
jgi:hypothetical protein